MCEALLTNALLYAHSVLKAGTHQLGGATPQATVLDVCKPQLGSLTAMTYTYTDS